MEKKYPIGVENYELYEEVGTGMSASVHRALCIPFNEIVAVKILDFERGNCDLNNICREAQLMVLVDHPNVLKSHCSFAHDHNLWVVTPFMAGGSCLHILKAAYPDGFEEVVIATILREALKGLEYLHHHGHIHRDVKAGNILIDGHGGIKLGDFGVSACLFDSGDRQRMRNTFVGTPCWMAPEVMEQLHGYDFKADIWSFGITALELAHGHAPFSKYPPMKVLLMTLQNAPPGLDYERDKKFSKSFRQMTASCLVKDPKKRPSAKKLLKHSFFKKARSSDYIAKTLLDGLPALGDRQQALKEKEEEMLAQKKMPDGEKEEISQNEYKRGISGWNFNLDDLKAQASLIQVEDLLSDQGGSSNSLAELDVHGRRLQHQLSFASQSSEAADLDENQYTSFSSAASSIGSNSKLQNLNVLSSSENSVTQTLDDVPSDTISKASKTSANGDELDEMTKSTVIKQKGRFKVTSEDVDREKVFPPPILHKSHSMQVISQHSALPPLPLSEATSPTVLSHSLFPVLQSVLQTNILQRDCILNLMKKISGGEPTVDRGFVSVNTAGEKSLMETAHDREKELLHEITDLQLRLISMQEELKKCKIEKCID